VVSWLYLSFFHSAKYSHIVWHIFADLKQDAITSTMSRFAQYSHWHATSWRIGATSQRPSHRVSIQWKRYECAYCIYTSYGWRSFSNYAGASIL